MELLSLGYIGVMSSRLDNWRGFATGLPGMQVVASNTNPAISSGGGTQAFRMEDRRQRLVVTGADGMCWASACPTGD